MTRSVCRVLFVVGIVVVAVASLTPQDELPQLDISDKLQHMGAYAALAFCGGLGWMGLRTRVLLAVLLVAIGIGIEAAQSLVPGRFPDPADAGANTAGAALGLALASAIEIARRRRAGPGSERRRGAAAGEERA